MTNALSKIFLLYNSLVSILIVVSLFFSSNHNVFIYLALVPLPVYFVIFTWENLFKAKTDIGITSSRAKFFVIIFIGLIVFAVYRFIKTPPVVVNSETISNTTVASPTPEAPIEEMIRIDTTQKTGKVNIYENMASDSAILGVGNNGDVFIVKSQSNGWYEVSLNNNQRGFVVGSEVSKY